MKHKVKIFDIDYLMSAELTDDDLHLLLDKHSLKYSLIVAEFNEAKIQLSDTDIIRACKASDKWMYNYFWSTSDLNSFINKLVVVFKNVYNWSEQKCLQEAQMWTVMYGLTNIRLKGSNKYILD